jgi:hypothetical protein
VGLAFEVSCMPINRLYLIREKLKLQLQHFEAQLAGTLLKGSFRSNRRSCFVDNHLPRTVVGPLKRKIHEQNNGTRRSENCSSFLSFRAWDTRCKGMCEEGTKAHTVLSRIKKHPTVHSASMRNAQTPGSTLRFYQLCLSR